MGDETSKNLRSSTRRSGGHSFGGGLETSTTTLTMVGYSDASIGTDTIFPGITPHPLE